MIVCIKCGKVVFNGQICRDCQIAELNKQLEEQYNNNKTIVSRPTIPAESNSINLFSSHGFDPDLWC